jgi:hypothetical protein
MALAHAMVGTEATPKPRTIWVEVKRKERRDKLGLEFFSVTIILFFQGFIKYAVQRNNIRAEWLQAKSWSIKIDRPALVNPLADKTTTPFNKIERLQAISAVIFLAAANSGRLFSRLWNYNRSQFRQLLAAQSVGWST